MASDSVNSYVEWLESVISKRVDGIVGGKYRKSYYKAALLIAALGEVKESLGTKLAKNFIINEYLKKFPRHTSFRGELKEYISWNFISAIGAGGGQGIIFNYSLGAEDEVVDVVKYCIEKIK